MPHLLKQILVFAWLATMLASPLYATPKADLKQTEAALQQEKERQAELAQELAGMEGELKTLRINTLKLTRDIRTHERELGARTREMASLAKDVASKEAALEIHKDELSLLMRSMRRMQHIPPITLIAYPAEGKSWARTGTALGHSSAALHKKSHQMRDDIASLQAVREALNSADDAMEKQKAQLTEQYTALQEKLSARQRTFSAIQGDTSASQKKIAELSKKSVSLQELIDALESEKSLASLIGVPTRKPTPPTDNAAHASAGSFASRKGDLMLPAVGQIIAHYGEQYKGEKSKGWHIASRRSAQVVTPHNGKVAFAGPFRDYGNMVILRHDNGYYTLLAGLGNIHTSPGQILLAGEPVGVMATNDDDNHILYLELRKHSKAIDPSGWIDHVNSNKNQTVATDNR